MLNSLWQQIRKYDMLSPGDTVVCAVSGGADSMALLWGMYLLREKLNITLKAAHFNHHLRGAESERDQAFVEEFCSRFDIPLYLGGEQVKAGKKGLEAAAREARYAFFGTLPGKIATAHTADDNGETVLMHLIRGTGLKGLGGIAPVRGTLIRPMLHVTRAQVLAFLGEYHIGFVEDSSNGTDDFLRNRVRHSIMPLLKEENPRISENLSAMAGRLRLDEQALEAMAECSTLPPVSELRKLQPGIRSRMLEQFLKKNGVKEPEAAHISLVEGLLFSENPSASVFLPGGITVGRNYETLEILPQCPELQTVVLPRSGTVELPGTGLRVSISEAEEIINTESVFTVQPEGRICLRCRLPGDRIRLSGGSKPVKKLFIDRKIPARRRMQIPVAADDRGILGVYSLGADRGRMAQALPAVRIAFEKIDSSHCAAEEI